MNKNWFFWHPKWPLWTPIAPKRVMMWYEIVRPSCFLGHCASFMSRWLLLREGGGGVCISYIGIQPNSPPPTERNSSIFMHDGASEDQSSWQVRTGYLQRRDPTSWIFTFWYGTKRNYIWFHINRKIEYTICFSLIYREFEVNFCTWTLHVN